MFEHIIKNLTEEAINKNLSRKDIINRLFQNEELKNKYINEIRRSTVIGQITNEILKKIWNEDLCKILAIGDIQFFWDLEIKWQQMAKRSLNTLDVSKISGYDLTWQWSQELRQSIVNYMTNYYNLGILETDITAEIIPTYGWTDGFVNIMDTLKNVYKTKQINFIYPEASFVANVKIAESFWVNTIKLNKPNRNNFFFTFEQIRDLYDSKISQNDLNIYYITPVGNPTWEKIENENLYSILQNIQKLDNEAIFIFDNVYVGLLIRKESEELFKMIFENKEVMERSIFSESLSKTLGTTWIRLGWMWTINRTLSEEFKKNIILKKAGFSKILDCFIINMLINNNEVINFQNEIYDYWSNQRMKFFAYIQENYAHLFDFSSSSNVVDRQWIYVFLKAKENLSAEDIFAETWIIGVWMKMSDGLYIRYAFGNVNVF